jgi:hypothetical protein
MMETKDWLFLVVGVTSVVLLYQQNRILSKGQQSNIDKYNPAPPEPHLQHWKRSLGTRWPLLAMGALAIASWIPYFLAPGKDVLMNYGQNGDRIFAQVDTQNINKADRLFMIVRMSDNSINFKTDTTIARSATVPVSRTPYTNIELPITKEFAQRSQEHPGLVDVYVFEVPEEFPFEAVKTISDAERRGAKHLADKSFGPLLLLVPAQPLRPVR